MRVKKNDTKFNYALLCNKICGGAHYKMKMMVVVLEEADYKKWEDSKLTQTFRDKYFASAAAPVVEETEAEEVVEVKEEVVEQH
jgi:cytochrome c oxidase subunit 2